MEAVLGKLGELYPKDKPEDDEENPEAAAAIIGGLLLVAGAYYLRNASVVEYMQR